MEVSEVLDWVEKHKTRIEGTAYHWSGKKFENQCYDTVSLKELKEFLQK